jgi:hypothetical protein
MDTAALKASGAQVRLPSSTRASNVLSWDTSDDVERLRRRFETLQDRRLAPGWGEPLAPQGITPAGGGSSRFDRGLQQAGQRQW